MVKGGREYMEAKVQGYTFHPLCRENRVIARKFRRWKESERLTWV